VIFKLSLPRREPWTISVLPKLRALVAQPGGLARLADITGMSPRRLWDVLSERSRPRQAARIALADAVTPALVQDASQDAPLPPKRRCAGCGVPLTALDPRQRYCSRACQQHAYRIRHQPPATTP